ncbi:MAG: sulfite exporter TauE/SafE family protein [candidate division WWE3 bacterium]|nr:sulfite exporter TauE/SafE family protein [candidate division WWE3 bacterium]
MFLPTLTSMGLGFLASLSTCAALIGSIVLTLSPSFGNKKVTGGAVFNAGRLVSFSLAGALLGLLGSAISLSPTTSSVLTIFISIFMILIGLQMLGVSALRKFQPPIFRKVTDYIDKKSSTNKLPVVFSVGFLTIFLPCGFTLAAEALAIASKNPLSGAITMISFTIGTLPVLMLMGIAGSTILKRPLISKIAGAIIIFMSLSALWQALVVLNVPLPQITLDNKEQTAGNSVVTNNSQLIKMDVIGAGYSPNTFTVKAGVPVRWEVNSTTSYTCANYLVAPSLNIGKSLQPGVNVFEFTPTTAGQIRFSCSMGMYRGVINVVN